MENTDSRKFIRISKNKNLKLMDAPQENGGLLSSLISVNLSESGLLFESFKAYDVGKQYTIRFTGSDNRLYDARIEILRVQETITNTQYSVGARFVDADSEIINRLLD